MSTTKVRGQQGHTPQPARPAGPSQLHCCADGKNILLID
jgi:hypothetical protein